MTDTRTWAEVEAPMQARAEANLERARAHLAEDVALAALAGPEGGRWKVDCRCAGPHADDCEERRIEGDDVTIYDEGGHDEHQARHIVRNDPAHALSKAASTGDALSDLERLIERSPDPDSRMWARAAVHSLARAWDTEEEEEARDARLEENFAAAKELCRVGHERCSYGGMSAAHGYWLANEDCRLNHGDACDLRVLCDGADAEAGFIGRDGEFPNDWIWRVVACGPCAEVYFRAHAGEWNGGPA